MRRSLRLGILVATATVALLAASVSSAASRNLLADPLAPACGYGDQSRVFLRWLDPLSYSLAPQGDLASTSDWTLSGASVSAAHDPYGLSARSLVFDRNGDTATTPWMCVNLENPVVRFLTVDRGGLGLGAFVVVLRYLAPDGTVVRLPISVAKPLRSWGPSLPVALGLNLLSVASSNGYAAVSLELHAVGLTWGESISADGFWVDPCRGR
ncbi:MAG TPA: hypothetical protein VFJ77_12135 [Gaiellaceae bacterium]|nr:hypothetical protein [Gaiellaceae bacterium]